jgi:hypothetical protein
MALTILKLRVWMVSRLPGRATGLCRNVELRIRAGLNPPCDIWAKRASRGGYFQPYSPPSDT